ncbi:MAG: DUF721 domain-containing protein [Chitinispirillaceae bacterium]
MKRSQPPSKVGAVLQSILQERGYSTICKEYEVVAKWKEIVGERVGAVTECSRTENGILYVKVKSAPWRQELAYLKGDLIKSIHRETDCTSIKDIIFY